MTAHPAPATDSAPRSSAEALPDPAALITLGHPMMDHDHAEALALLAAAEATPPGALAPAFAALADHLRAHFAREEALMAETGFFAQHCHSAEHARLLAVFANLQATLTPHHESPARTYLRSAFPSWFDTHLVTMDRVTAGFLMGGDGDF
ncbi:bacteriohemerythrin [Azospirillum griseum]|uniref:Hemerythrin n=1 Tax=Azospirillum griseum TaxID=2496639 RepID=A0A3S0R954_9PROT|nr:hemerythrin family protein [Azospirillum griseum]RTR20554.1 hemerythrin [Azospirillum griseum]